MGTQPPTVSRWLGQYAQAALEILPELYDPDRGLFSHKAWSTGRGYQNQGSNVLYSAICLIGLQRHGSDKARSVLAQTAYALDGIFTAVGDVGDPSTVATALWALQLAGDERAHILLRRLDESLDTVRVSSMGLGLVLAAVAETIESTSMRDRAARIAARCQSELTSRFASSAGLFRGSRKGGSDDFLHARVTSFAYQVYAILGLAEHARAVSGTIAPEAVRAADRLAGLQGPDGQWWWMYSSVTGSVLEAYPVYVVHQDAMAFLALANLQNLGAGSYESVLRRGLEWVAGANELGRPLYDATQPWFCRAVQRLGSDPNAFGGMSRSNHLRLVLRSIAPWPARRTPAAPTKLEVLEEDRSYHLGWLLYADTIVREGARVG
jgi:hypothetical protein